MSSSTSTATPILTARALEVGYRGRAILPPVDLTIREGEFWAVVGANGSGKTTLLRTLLGLLPSVAGRYDWSESAVTSYVAQRGILDGAVPSRVRDFVWAGHDRGWSFLSRRRASDDLLPRALEDAQCAGLVDESYSSLSEGQRGRVRIARALISAPTVLVLDEPTSAVDSATERAIFQTLDDLRRSRGMTLVVVSHRVHIFASRATHAAFVDRHDGVVLCGEFSEIVQARSFLSRHGPVSAHAYELPSYDAGQD